MTKKIPQVTIHKVSPPEKGDPEKGVTQAYTAAVLRRMEDTGLSPGQKAAILKDLAAYWEKHGGS